MIEGVIGRTAGRVAGRAVGRGGGDGTVGGAVRPWYEDYFRPEFWTVAEHEYTAERTGHEVSYLASVLDRFAPGRRVLDLGCGTGRHAIGLAARGYDVVGLDVSEWALARAAEAALAAGVGARCHWVHCDLLRTRPLPVGIADAAICVQSFGLGSDAEQLRLLREVRRSLVPGGLLILDHSNVLAIARHYAAEATFQAGELRADFHRSFRAVSGRSVGSVTVTRGGEAPTVLHDDVRLYQSAEVRDLLERAGFEIERVDAEFVEADTDTAQGAQVGIESRYVQFLARNPADAHARTSLDAYRRDGDASSASADQRLDLRWTPDEIEFVRPAVDAAIRAVTSRDVVDIAREYAVTDPYAGARAAPVLSAHFDADLAPDTVTAGAGITGLLHSLAALAQPGPVLYQVGGHPDLPRWAALAGARVHAAGPRLDELVGEIAERRPALVLLDRPTITGEFADAEFVGALCEEAEAWAATVVVDEAYATYPGPSASCIPLVNRHKNLVVLRSMSKGYCCGGLRIGFAVADAEVTARLRELIPPLSANSAGLAVAMCLLEQGDVFGPLRDRIAVVKPIVSAALRDAGLHVTDGAPFVPWVTAVADDDARKTISSRGLIVKELSLPPPGAGALLKIALPLSAERMRAFGTLFGLPEVP